MKPDAGKKNSVYGKQIIPLKWIKNNIKDCSMTVFFYIPAFKI